MSYLSEGEPDHATLQAVVSGWRRIGGRVSVAVPVLEEVAHHAAIAERDFEEVYHRMATYSDEDARRLMTNAFTRGYCAAGRRRGEPYSVRAWRQYIGNFRGQSAEDVSRIIETLRDSGVHLLSDEAVDSGLVKSLSQQILDTRLKGSWGTEKPVTKELQDKSNRDGRLVALLIHHRKSGGESGRIVVIVSSSSLLRQACKDRKELAGPAEAVMPLAAVAYLLALAPGVQISMQSLKRILFDPGLAERLTPLQRRALRIIRDSTQYSMPYSRRPALQREMLHRMSQIAAERGETVEDLVDKLGEKNDEQADLLAVVSKAIDAIAYSESEKRIRSLCEEIDRLRAENSALRDQARHEESGQSLKPGRS